MSDLARSPVYRFSHDTAPIIKRYNVECFSGIFSLIFAIRFFSLNEAVLTCTHNLCFEQKFEKFENVSTENCHVLQL